MSEPAPIAVPAPRVPLVARWFLLTGLAAVAGAGLVLGALRREEPATVSAPRAHYLYVSELEMQPRTPSGGRWDGVSDAPDPCYEIHWRGTRVFRSVTKQDTLVASWSAARVGLDSLADGSLDGVVRAARVTPLVGSGEQVEFRVYDADVLFDDPVARWSIPLESLRPGATRVIAPAPGIGYVVYQLAPCDDGGAGLLLR